MGSTLKPPVIDVDSHWTVPWEFRLEEGPLRHWSGKLPAEAGQVAFFLAADALAAMPDGKRPPAEQLFPAQEQSSIGMTHIPEQFLGDRRPSRVTERLAWMDQVGIDFSIVNGPAFPALFPLLSDGAERATYLRDCNDLLQDMVAAGRDRLSMVTYVDMTDLDSAIAELKRGRAAGSRAVSIRAEPVNGLSLGHAHFDRLWLAVVDLGMVVSLHIGLSPTQFGDWCNLGFDFNEAGDRARFLRYANSQRYQGAEAFISAMLFGGAFERHPGLTILLSELFVFWLPDFVRKMDMLSINGGILGEWPYDRTAGQMLRDQVRASPLPGLGDGTAVDVINQLPGMIVFSSDFPHAEGNVDPIRLYGASLGQLPQEVRENFLGRSMVAAFAATGDPLMIR